VYTIFPSLASAGTDALSIFWHSSSRV